MNDVRFPRWTSVGGRQNLLGRFALGGSARNGKGQGSQGTLSWLRVALLDDYPPLSGGELQLNAEKGAVFLKVDPVTEPARA